jgi:hypothetical protein
MGPKPNAADIAAGLSPRNRWRLHHRYRRELAGWQEAIETGDLLGTLASLRRAMLLTAPKRFVS